MTAPFAYAAKVVQSSVSHIDVVTKVEEEDEAFRVVIQDDAAKHIYNGMTHFDVTTSTNRFNDLNQFENTKTSIGYIVVCTEHVSKWPNGEIFTTPSYVCTIAVPTGKLVKD